MDAPSEIELKLEVAPDDLPRLRESPLLKDAEAGGDRLVSHYFDSPDRKLRRAGFTLRVRDTRDGLVQTVKQEGTHAAGLFVRPEWERPVDQSEPVIDKHGPLAELVDPHELEIAFTTDVARDVRNVAVGGARIEVAFDDGHVSSGSGKSALCEIELELKGGAPEPLFALARELNALVPLRVGVRSKSERGYALAAGEEGRVTKAEPIMLDREAQACAGFAAIAAACIRHFRLNEPLLLETGEVEPVHQARVALRRLRSAFSSFHPLLAGDPRGAVLRAELRWLASQLGKVRDLDVLIPRIEGHGRARLEEARAQALAEAQAALNSLRARDLMIGLSEWLAIGAWRIRPAEPERAKEAIASLARDILRRHRKRLGKRGHHLAKLSDHDRHKARIEAKKLRYAAEFLGSLWPDQDAQKRRGTFLAALETLQELLGDLNDQVTAAALLDRHGLDAPEPGKDRKKMLKHAEAALDELLDATPFWD